MGRNSEKVRMNNIRYREKHREILNAKDRERYYKNIEYNTIYRKKRYERDKSNHTKWIFNNAKWRAKRKGLEFSITSEDIIIPTHCPILGIPLFSSNGKSGGKDNSPSIDRIDNDKGYIKGNIMIISNRANTIKSFGTADEHIRIGTFMKSYGYDL